MSAQVTEAHYDLRRQVIFSDADEGAELIADSEARATERLRREIDWLQLNNDMLTDNPVGHARAVAERQAIVAERDELRAEVERLKADGAASAFINMSCRASRAEADRNNLRADLDAIKAILNEEKARAERSEAYDTDGTPWKTVCGWWSKKYDAVERQMCENAARAERAEAELATWHSLRLWGTTPEIVNEFIKGQQARIHAAQDIEVELAAERARLDWVALNRTVSAREKPWSVTPESLRKSIAAAMKEGA
jgi:hypothetical protein